MKVKLKSLHPHPSNPRFIKSEEFLKLVKRILKFPKMLSVRGIVYENDGTILGGRMRWEALKHIVYILKEWTEEQIQDDWFINADEKSFTDEEKREFLISDNTHFGDWDRDILANEFNIDELQDLGLHFPEWDEILNPELTKNRSSRDDTFLIPKEVKTLIALGDIIKIGPHTLICGDAKDKTAWDRLQIIPGAVCFASPPYNAGKSGKLSGNKITKQNGSMYPGSADDLKPDQYASLLNASLLNALQYCEAAAINVQLLSGNKRTVIEWMNIHRESFVDLITWNKENAQPAMAAGVLNSAFEWIPVFSAKNNSRKIPLSSWRGTVSNIYTGAPQRNNEFSEFNGATFPLHLPKFILSEVFNKAAAAVDCFLGMGTTMVAAHEQNIPCFGIELEPTSCQIIINRMLNLDATLAVTINDQQYTPAAAEDDAKPPEPPAPGAKKISKNVKKVGKSGKEIPKSEQITT